MGMCVRVWNFVISRIPIADEMRAYPKKKAWRYTSMAKQTSRSRAQILFACARVGIRFAVRGIVAETRTPELAGMVLDRKRMHPLETWIHCNVEQH